MENWMFGGLLAGGASAQAPLDLVLLQILVSALCSAVVGWAYMRTHGALSYSQNFVQSIVMLAIVVTIIMGVVGDSLTRAFGLAAALAVVRFRTPVKDARDTVFLFMAVAEGMACGAGQIGFAAVVTAAMVTATFLLEWTAFGTRSIAEGVLRFRFAGDETQREKVATVLRRHSRNFRLSGARKGGPGAPEELIYDIDVASDAASEALVAELSAIEAVSAVALLPYARVGEG
ncbi:MAG: DUF4956 domain-containing protein [Alphaproteobacteria bacterium]|nr:DUF4956 domain-containing protein [Alphaproteobacteria bacterium]